MWRGAGQLLVGLVVFAVLALVLGISLAHRGDGGNPASAHVHGPKSPTSPSPSSSCAAVSPSPSASDSPVDSPDAKGHRTPRPEPADSPSPSPSAKPSCSPTPTPSPSPTAEPSPTAAPATPAPTPLSTPSGIAELTFTGAVTGTMSTATVSCGTNIPEGDGGVIQVTGQVAGSTWQVQIWSAGPAPGKVQYIQLWHGTPVSGGTIDFQNSALSGGNLAGITRFDWARGATLDTTLTDFTNARRPPVHIQGAIGCAAPTPTPTPAPQREPVLSGPSYVSITGAITGVLQGPVSACQPQVSGGNGGMMSVSGTIGGTQYVISIWGGGSGPGTPNEIYEGPVAGQIDYGQIGADGPNDLSGITGFDWRRGATFSIDLPYVGWVGKQSQAPNPLPPAIHVSGQIVC